LDEHWAELVARIVASALDAAELRKRSAPSLVFRHARLDVLLSLLIDVKADLFAETPFEGVAADD